MAKFVIDGGKPLAGEIEVVGAKNAALKIFPAVFLTDEPIRVTNLPEIEDVKRAEEMIVALGHEARQTGKREIEIQFKNQDCLELPEGLVKRFRAAIMFAGTMLARCGEVSFPHPGGDVIGTGQRPIDMFLDGFKKMGAQIEILDGSYRLRAKKLRGAEIFFHRITVTGTESLMMAAILAEGVTILKNCAMEPEIPALADFLNSIGARINGAGTSIIKIEGVKKLRGGEYKIIPDRIEAGTFAILAAAMRKNEILVKNCIPEHLEALWILFDRIGVRYILGKDSVRILPEHTLKACDAITHEYPGFATDLQSPYTVLMTQAYGASLIHETIYDRRLLYTDLLVQMGANIIMADPHRVIVTGPTKLIGRKLVSPDVRAGIALIIAALIAEGKTEIDNIYQIDRGYENLDSRLRSLGASVTRIN